MQIYYITVALASETRCKHMYICTHIVHCVYALMLSTI